MDLKKSVETNMKIYNNMNVSANNSIKQTEKNRQYIYQKNNKIETKNQTNSYLFHYHLFHYHCPQSSKFMTLHSSYA